MPHPTTAPAGGNRSGYGGDEIAEAFGIARHELVNLDFRCGSNSEVSDGHGNVGFRGYSGRKLAKSGHRIAPPVAAGEPETGRKPAVLAV